MKEGTWTLVVTGGEGPPPGVLAVLASGCSRIIAADSGLAAALAAGLKVDLWVGDMDSWEGPFPEGVPRQVHPRDKAFSDTRLALDACAGGPVCLAGGGGGRMDHLWSLMAELALNPQVKRWYTGNDEIFMVHDTWDARLAPGTVLSLFSVHPARVQARGLRWSLDGMVLGPACHSLSNEASDGLVSLRVEGGPVLVVRGLDPSRVRPPEAAVGEA